MGKRRWRRVRPADLAAREVQEQLLKQPETVQEQGTAPEQESPAKRPPKAALERRTQSAGRDLIDHGPRGNDDLANAVAWVCGMIGAAAALARGRGI
jgi:hypothetical protein